MRLRLSFTLALTVVTLLLSLAPSAIIWVVFRDLLASSLDLLRGTTKDATDSMVQHMQQLTMSEAMQRFTLRLMEGDTELLVQRSMMEASGLLSYDLRPSRFDIQQQFLTPYRVRNFIAMKGHQNFLVLSTTGAVRRDDTDASSATTDTAIPVFGLSWVALFVDVRTQASGNRTLHCDSMAMAPDGQWVTTNSTYVNQATAVPLIQLSSQTVPASSTAMPFAPNGWDTTLGFNAFTGQVQLTGWHWLPAQNDTWIQVSLSISANAISEELRAQLSDAPADRLVLFFRQRHGHMIAASHGKFYSHSDMDLGNTDPLTNPPNLTAYRLWTCLESTDALIQQACEQLFGEYHSWPAIPALYREMELSGEPYWAATDFSTGSLQCMVLLLQPQAPVMADIQAGNAEVDRSVSDKKGVTFIIFGAVIVAGCCIPLAMGLWLANRLHNLAAGMDRIAKLQFSANSLPPTIFQELHRFQTSFIQMERGLQAFGKFVPQAVVKVLIAGDMQTDEMKPETVTVMFADIEGFSTICETVLSEVLVTVCTEYFEVMCSSIVQRNGTIDKFIGDCIMAMWNAPEHLPGHERHAVSTSLAMQASVMELHKCWQRRGLPLLKFRIGIHTGVCLVGNFGCSHRVSYTCLGDGVNLSARLEALNKKFGTFICVSHATYDACRSDFHFRKLGRVTVPGKAEVLPAYEVLCEVDAAENPTFSSPNTFELSMEFGEASEILLMDSSAGSSVGYLPSPQFSSLPTELPDSGQVPYHWTYVDRAELLRQAREYEEAYEAMVAGGRPPPSLAMMRQAMTMKSLGVITDKAWATLAGQQGAPEAGHPWDGVFYFREK